MALRLVTILFVSLLLVGGSSHAQGSPSQTIDGQLTAVEPAVDVLLRPVAGETITLTLTAPELDPTLTILDAIGQVVAFNDDHDDSVRLPSPRDAALTYAPQLADPLIVRVGSFHWAYAGPFTLTVTGAEIIDQTPVSIWQDASGAVVEGRITAQPERVGRVAYSFPALAGWPVSLWLTSDEFDTVLEVYNIAGELVASNDDHDEAVELTARTDSALTFTTPEDSIYYVLVRAYEDEESGRFTLRISGATFGSASVFTDENTRTGTCNGVLGAVVEASSSYGSNFSAENLLDGSVNSGWSSRGDDAAPTIIFEVNAGLMARIDGIEFNGFSASPGFVDDSVRAFEVAVSTTLDDAALFTTVLEAEAPLENAPQTYSFDPVDARYVMLRMLSNYGGDYFQATTFDACTGLTGRNTGSLSGVPPFLVSGNLLPDAPFVEYRLYTQENAALTATLTSEAFDPVLEVYDEFGRRLADNDDHTAPFDLPLLHDAALTLNITEPGMIVVRVRSFAGGGEYILTIDGQRIQAQPPDVPGLPPCNDVSSQAVGGQIVAASSAFGGRWLAEYLIDGSNETGWASGPADESARSEYVIIELAPGTHELVGIRINPAATGGDSTANNISRFAVLASNSPEPDSFAEVFSTLLGERYRHTLAFALPAPVTARYVMLETRDSFGGRWHEVAEFTVCATSAPTSGFAPED